MAPKKRRVVTGPQDARPDAPVYRPALPKYSQIVQGSVSDYLRQLDSDRNPQPQDKPVPTDAVPGPQPDDQPDQTKVGHGFDPDTMKKKSVIFLPKGYTGQKNFTKQNIVTQDEPQKPAAGRNADYEAKRAQQIGDILTRYNKAVELSNKRNDLIGGAATSIAFSNPSAAAQYRRGYQGYINQPRQKFQGGQKFAGQQVDLQSKKRKLAQSDEQNDPSSQLSRAYRDYAKKRFGMQLSQGVSAAAIKKMFPSVSLEEKTQTQKRGQDITAQQKQLDRQSKQRMQQHQLKAKTIWQGNRNASRQRVAALMAQAGVDKQVIGKVLSGQYAWQKRAAAGASRTSTGVKDRGGNVYQNVTSPGKYWIRDVKRQGPADQNTKRQANRLQVQTQKVRSASQMLNQVIQDAKRGLFDQYKFSQMLSIYGQLQSAYQSLTQTQPKFHQNGVMNFADLDRAIRQVGSADSLLKWASGGNVARNAQYIRSVQKQYNDAMRNALGYSQGGDKQAEQFQKQYGAFSRTGVYGQPSETSGSGQAQAGRQRQVDATEAADAALSRHNLPPVKRKRVVPTPTPAPVPPPVTTTQPQKPDIPSEQQQTAQKRRKAAQVLKRAMQR